MHGGIVGRKDRPLPPSQNMEFFRIFEFSDYTCIRTYIIHTHIIYTCTALRMRCPVLLVIHMLDFRVHLVGWSGLYDMQAVGLQV